MSNYGKLKTVLQSVAIGMLIYRHDLHIIPIYEIGLVMLFVAAGLTLWSMFAYILSAWPKLKESYNRREMDRSP